MLKILVAYATKHQSTAEIAEFIGDILRRSQFEVHVLDVDEIKTVQGYSAVIIGSAVYVGHWLRSANNFLRQYQNQLAQIPVWIFSTGPTGKGNPVDLLEGFEMPENVREVVKFIQPRHVMLFHGRLERDRLGIGERMMLKAVKAPIGDFRDWDMIRAWTNRIVAEIQSEQAVPI